LQSHECSHADRRSKIPLTLDHPRRHARDLRLASLRLASLRATMIVAWAGYRGARVRARECRKSYKDGDDIGAIAVAGTWVSICEWQLRVSVVSK
jgi:hypothetical protein